MEARISAMTLSSPSDSLFPKVVVFLFTMMDREVEHVDTNLAESCNGGPSQFYRAQQWASIVLAKIIIRDNTCD